MYVFGLARSEDKLQDLARELGDRFTPVRCDVRLEAGVVAAFTRVEQDAGRLDVLVNNDGIGFRGDAVVTPYDTRNTFLSINARGVYTCGSLTEPTSEP